MYDLYRFTLEHTPYGWVDFFNENVIKVLKCISDNIQKDEEQGYNILPPLPYVWNAFYHTSLQDTKIVIIGQDPYPNARHSMGIAFCALNDIPDSAKNIFALCKNTIEGFTLPKTADLRGWSSQGVLLLNSAFTLVEGKPGSHSRCWTNFMINLVEFLSAKKNNLVFMLWGNEAKKWKRYIDKNKHCILETSHPSSLGVRFGFFESDHFNKANQYLASKFLPTIDWTQTA